MYIFGGKNEEGKMNDIWEFNLKSYKFTELHNAEKNPISRSGATLTAHGGVLYLFGGIHDITW